MPTPLPLYEATFAGSSNGNVRATTTHKHTHSDKQMLYVLCVGPLVWTSPFFSVTPPSLAPSEPFCSLSSFFLSADPESCKCQAARGEERFLFLLLLLKHIKPTGITGRCTDRVVAVVVNIDQSG